MIRKLEMKDFPHMYEWMKDKSVTENLQANFASFSEQEVREFIQAAMQQNENSTHLHFAIVDEQDEYMGTISLKNIDKKNMNAEYAIVTRKKAHGKGFARIATYDLLNIAFEEIGLEKVYLYVAKSNIVANKFYKKVGFIEEGVFRKHLLINEKLEDIIWYSLLKTDMEDKE